MLAVCGDGGFMMNSQEMETAVRLGVHIVVLILEDHAYGMIRWKQEADHFADFGLNSAIRILSPTPSPMARRGSRVDIDGGFSADAEGRPRRQGRASGRGADRLQREYARAGQELHPVAQTK